MMKNGKEDIEIYYKHKMGKRLENREKVRCKLHKDWSPLTREELKKINRNEKYGYMIYKNIML